MKPVDTQNMDYVKKKVHFIIADLLYYALNNQVKFQRKLHLFMSSFLYWGRENKIVKEDYAYQTSAKPRVSNPK